MKRPLAGLVGLLLAAAAIRLACLPLQPFYGDVPLHLKAIESGRMVIQFPGYTPFHWLIRLVALVTPSVFDALVAVSLAAGLLSILYVWRAARRLGGEEAAWPAATVYAVSVPAVYFSTVGSSYALDMLFAAGMIAHGLDYLEGGRRRPALAALAWLCFGCLMRPLSAAGSVCGLVCLLAKRPDRRLAAVSAAALALTAILFLAMTIPSYGGTWKGLATEAASLRGEVLGRSLANLLTNATRFLVYPIYGLHLWLAAGGWARSGRTTVPAAPPGGRTFLLWTFAPYAAMLFFYIPHAGYICLLVPALVLAPLCRSGRPAPGRPRVRLAITAAFVAVALTQLFLLRPVANRGIAAVAANAYGLQYSRAGIRLGMFETLSSLAWKSGVWRDRIPPHRVRHVLTHWPEPARGGKQTNAP